jgi:hypothetical protein
MKVCEPNAFLSQAVNVGRSDFSAKTCGVRESQVIREDDEKIRPFGFGRG